jgi:KDO2-lipid IV(A) lauroyltransferase
MPKKRSKPIDYCVYLVVRVLVHFLQAIPLSAIATVSGWLGRLAYQLNARHRQVAFSNLRLALGEGMPDEELDKVVQATYKHFCSVLLEIVQLPRKLHVHNWRQFIRLSGADLLVGELLSGRPVLFVTGHFGNWELAGYALGLLGFKTCAVARPLDNPYLDEFLRRFREGTGQKLLAKKGELDKIQEVLASGGVICTLADQDAGRHGLFVPFFGRLASTHKAIALLALQQQATLVVCGARKLGSPLKYEICVTDVIYPGEYSRNPRAVYAITERFTAAIEKLVRLDIRQYFWLHRRWKHQPEQRNRKAA